MRTATTLVRTADFSIRAVVCREMHAGWSAPEFVPHHGVVLVRTGRFRLRQAGRAVLAESTTAYVHSPGAEIEFAHPAGGDVCTAVAVSPELWTSMMAEPASVVAVPVDGRLDLAHRVLLRTARTPAIAAVGPGSSPPPHVPDDAGFATAEILVTLLQVAGARVGESAADPRRRAPSAAAVALVAAAKEAILSDDPAARGLIPLAQDLRVSPAYLSRSFRAVSGVRLTQYRIRVRVGWALDRIERGEQDLARLAADLGFADQAHMTRVIKAQVGTPPARLKFLLQADHAARVAEHAT